MKISKLNLIDLDSKLKYTDNCNIPNEINLSIKELEEFNNRIINPLNINKIIKLCLFLKVSDINNFILKNIVATENIYNIDEEYQDLINLPKFMIDKNDSLNKNDYYLRTKNHKPRYFDLCVRSVELDLVKWLEWGHKNNYGWHDGQIINHLCNIAAINNSLNCIKYLYNSLGVDIKWDSSTSKYAASYGNLDFLKYLHKNGCSWDWRTCKHAAEAGHLNCLKYAHSNGCECKENCSYYAIKYGNLDCLYYLEENNCPFIYNSGEVAAKYNKLECLKYILSKKLFVEKDLAAKILLDNSFDDFRKKYFDPMLKIICYTCIEKGHLECFKYIYENYDIKLNFKSELLGESRNIEFLKFLYENNMIIDDSLSYLLSSSRSKDFEFIIYFVDNKLPGYDRFLSEHFLNKISKRIRWGGDEFKIFLKSSYFGSRLEI